MFPFRSRRERRIRERNPQLPRRSLLPPKVENAFASRAFGFICILDLTTGKASTDEAERGNPGSNPGASVSDPAQLEPLIECAGSSNAYV